MPDLQRRRLCPRIAVEENQSRGASERVDALRQRLLVDLERGEFGLIDTASGVGSVSQRDQAQEELPRCLLRVSAQPQEELLCASGQRAGDAADRLVRRTREGRSVAALEELGQRVL